MRFFRFNTPLLALIFSIVMEALSFAVFKLFGTVTEFGSFTNFWSQSWFCIHWLPLIVTDRCVTMANGSILQDVVGFVIFFSIALLEWWLVLFAAIWLIRRFTRKTA